MQATKTIRTPEDLGQLIHHLGNMKQPFVCITRVGEPKRTDAMNRTVHKWFGEISAYRGDVTALDVKAECNLIYGRPILVRDDPEWSAVFGYLFEALPHEKKIKAIRVLDVPFTRRMTVKQLCEYMDQLQRDYLQQGVSLTIPEDQR